MDGLDAAAAWFAGDRGPEERARRQLLEECPHPLALAMRLDTTVVSTPAMELISRRWVETLQLHDGRLVLSTPGQQGKSQLSRWAVFWALLDDPGRRVVFASYALSLARTSGRLIRGLVESYGAPYGLRLDQAHHDATDWQLADGHLGGVVSASPDSRLTGVPCDVMVIDDIYAGEQEAQSAATRATVETWWESTARIRMRPGAPAIAIGTRFAEPGLRPQDLLSRFIDEGWTRVNIPALADGKAVDSLEGVPGARTDDGWLISTRGTTPADWAKIRTESTERVFTALMQGSPTAPEGNLFRRSWFDASRVRRDEVPELRTIVIAVDPAETGTGDEAGILVGGSSASGDCYLLADLSGMLSQAQWARRICLGLLQYGAHRALSERTLGLNTAIGDAWAIIVRQARALDNYGGDLDRAMVALSVAGDHQAADQAALAEVLPVLEAALALPSSGPRVVTVTPRQSKRVRAEAVTSLWELGRAHIVGRLPQLEQECLQWTPGVGRSPNRIDVMAHLLTHLDNGRGGGTVRISRGTGAVPTRTTPQSMPSTAQPTGRVAVSHGQVRPWAPSAHPALLN